MELRDVKIGMLVKYRGRKNTGTATVTGIKPGATGPYFVLRDDAASRFIDLRPSQFDPVKAKKPRVARKGSRA
jgi:hypothetical protein